LSFFLQLVYFQEELERQSAYFDVLEKTEQMETKMDSIKEKKCKAYSCVQVSFVFHCYLCKTYCTGTAQFSSWNVLFTQNF